MLTKRGTTRRTTKGGIGNVGGESIDADGVRGMGTPSSTSSRGGEGRDKGWGAVSKWNGSKRA